MKELKEIGLVLQLFVLIDLVESGEGIERRIRNIHDHFEILAWNPVKELKAAGGLRPMER